MASQSSRIAKARARQGLFLLGFDLEEHSRRHTLRGIARDAEYIAGTHRTEEKSEMRAVR